MVVICMFLMTNDVEFVLYAYLPFVYLLWKMFIHILCLFLSLFLLLNDKSSLYILHTSPLFNFPFNFSDCIFHS